MKTKLNTEAEVKDIIKAGLKRGARESKNCHYFLVSGGRNKIRIYVAHWVQYITPYILKRAAKIAHDKGWRKCVIQLDDCNADTWELVNMIQHRNNYDQGRMGICLGEFNRD